MKRRYQQQTTKKAENGILQFNYQREKTRYLQPARPKTTNQADNWDQHSKRGTPIEMLVLTITGMHHKPDIS